MKRNARPKAREYTKNRIRNKLELFVINKTRIRNKRALRARGRKYEYYKENNSIQKTTRIKKIKNNDPKCEEENQLNNRLDPTQRLDTQFASLMLNANCAPSSLRGSSEC